LRATLAYGDEQRQPDRRAGPVGSAREVGMATPRATPLATPVDLGRHRNIGDDALVARLQPAYGEAVRRIPAGRQVFRGLPFRLATARAQRRWILLDRRIDIDLRSYGPASHVVIAHFCDAWRGPDGQRPADLPVGWVTPVGQALARYTVEPDTGPSRSALVRRRFEVNEGIIGWGQGAFAARPHLFDEPLDWRGPYPGQAPALYAPPGEAGLLAILPGTWGPAQTGVADRIPSPTGEITLWLYEIEVAGRPRTLDRLRIEPLAPPDAGSAVVIAAITLFRGRAAPLALEPRRTLRVESESGRPTVSVDLGQVIRDRPAPATEGSDGWPAGSIAGWGSIRTPASTTASEVDVAVAPDGEISVDGASVPAHRLAADGRRRRSGSVTIQPLPPADRRVEVEVVDAATGEPIPARVHFRAADGRYLPPLGHREEVNPGLNEDVGADLFLGDTPYAYVPGRFAIELPPGTVQVEVAHGFEHRPLRRSIEIDRPTGPLVLPLEPIAAPSAEGWLAADCHVHFISPTSALLQAQAEGVAIVNLLATQWGDHHTSVTDLPSLVVSDRAGRHLVVMGSENRQNMLGHIGLLGAARAVLPMASGGAPESRLGDPLGWLIADWADAARAQRGLALAVHFPLPYAEVAADIVTGRIDAVEMQALTPGVDGPSIREWYRFLDCGYRLPIVGGTDKMTAEIPLGAIRTYARLDKGRELSFEAWSEAVRAGRTFVSSGPLIEFLVDGHEPGDTIGLGPDGGTVEVRATAWAALPVIDGLQLVHDGRVVASTDGRGGVDRLGLAERVEVTRGGWLAVRATSRQLIRSAFSTAMGAHSSPVYLDVPGRPAFDPAGAAVIRSIIEGSRTWVASIATVASKAERRRMAAYFEAAAARLDAVALERSG
jgi:hypothetical protein